MLSFPVEVGFAPSSEKRLVLSLGNAGLLVSRDRGGHFLPLELGRAVAAAIIEAAGESLTAHGRGLLRRYRKRIDGRFPRLAEDVRRARPAWRKQQAELRAIQRRFERRFY